MCVRSIILFFILLNPFTNSFAADRYIPNDPLFPSQWWADNSGQTIFVPIKTDEKEKKITLGRMVGTPDIDVDLPEAWAIERGGPDCLIAVLDAGFQLDHPELSNKFTKDGWNFIRNDSILTAGDDHGTSVAGIIASEMDNNIGIAGVAPGCKILPLVVTVSINNTHDIKKSKKEFPVSDAIRYAIQMKATVISVSLGIPPLSEIIKKYAQVHFGSPEIPADKRASITEFLSNARQSTVDVLKTVIGEAYNANIPVIAGAGNFPNEEKNYPAGFESVISVASINIRGELSAFSTRGDWVTVAAPGEEVLTCANTWSDQVSMPCPIANNCQNHGDYCHPSGTSLAAPIVSGVVGLLKSHYPDLTVDEIRATLINSGKKLGSTTIPLVSAERALLNPVRLNQK